jgi:hypothetical protein
MKMCNRLHLAVPISALGKLTAYTGRGSEAASSSLPFSCLPTDDRR